MQFSNFKPMERVTLISLTFSQNILLLNSYIIQFTFKLHISMFYIMFTRAVLLSAGLRPGRKVFFNRNVISALDKEVEIKTK